MGTGVAVLILSGYLFLVVVALGLNKLLVPRPPAIARGFIFVVLLPFWPLCAFLANGWYIRRENDNGEERWITIIRSNLFFSFVSEAEAKIVVRGGSFAGVIYNLRGHKLTSDYWVVPLSPGEAEPWHVWGGLRFYGMWPIFDVLVYKFPRFTSVLTDGTERPHEEELTDKVFLKLDMYQFIEESVETSDPLNLLVKVLLRITVVNPYLAAFGGWEWLEIAINEFRPRIRDAVAQSTYEELLKERTSAGGRLFEDSLDLRNQLRNLVGAEVGSIEIRDFDPPPEYRQITLLRYTAEEQAKAVIETAKGEAQRIVATAQAESQGIVAKAQAEAQAITAEYGAVKGQGLVGIAIRLLRPKK